MNQPFQLFDSLVKSKLSWLLPKEIKFDTPKILSLSTRQFSEVGLHEWMPFVIFCARSCKRSQLPLLGWFLSRGWFMLCITMEVEPTAAKQYKCYYCCMCKITGERWWRIKSIFASFPSWPEDHVSNLVVYAQSTITVLSRQKKIMSAWKKAFLGQNNWSMSN